VTRARALVLAGPGTNRDPAAVRALQMAGANATVILATQLVRQPDLLDGADMLVIAGGFSYADALGSGRLLAMQLQRGNDGLLGKRLGEFVASARPVLGICNGFQVLTQAGLLPGALGHNQRSDGTSGFDCRWVRLAAEPSSVCVWTRGIDIIDSPIAHGEGRYVHSDCTSLAAAGQVALRYVSDNVHRNPNGSTADIAGVCDSTGVVLGLMPHPEDHVLARQHPQARRISSGNASGADRLGLQLFDRGVAHARSL
jgi:phosphoribosylformylglycinamidine synthase subunit PurQ / glutaminase